MTTWDKGKPKTLGELFDFYNNYVKVLYSAVQTHNTLPVDTLFELNATLDHISRKWTYGESDEFVVAQAYGHLKRSCLDLFKITFREMRDQYDRISSLDYIDLIDNGEFERNLHQFFNEIQMAAILARTAESKTDVEGDVPAFTLWEDVYVMCRKFETDFFLHKRLNWGRKKSFIGFLRRNAIGFILGVLASVLASIIYQALIARSS